MKVRTVVLLVVLATALVILDTTMQRDRPESSKPKDSALVALAGEFRTVFANLLWIKMDHYHHEYEENHADWTQDKNSLGLDRIVTSLDPHFEEAYATGSRMMIGQRRLKEAKAYLQEGIDNNPDSMLLHDELGTMLAVHFHDYRGALYHLRRAYCIVKEDYDHRKGSKADREDDEWQMKRLGRLAGTVERIVKEEGEVKSPKSKVTSREPDSR